MLITILLSDSTVPYKVTVESAACSWGETSLVIKLYGHVWTSGTLAIGLSHWQFAKSGLQEQPLSKNSRKVSCGDVDRVWGTSTGVQSVTHKEGRISIHLGRAKLLVSVSSSSVPMPLHCLQLAMQARNFGGRGLLKE